MIFDFGSSPFSVLLTFSGFLCMFRSVFGCPWGPRRSGDAMSSHVLSAVVTFPLPRRILPTLLSCTADAQLMHLLWCDDGWEEASHQRHRTERSLRGVWEESEKDRVKFDESSIGRFDFSTSMQISNQRFRYPKIFFSLPFFSFLFRVSFEPRGCHARRARSSAASTSRLSHSPSPPAPHGTRSIRAKTFRQKRCKNVVETRFVSEISLRHFLLIYPPCCMPRRARIDERQKILNHFEYKDTDTHRHRMTNLRSTWSTWSLWSFIPNLTEPSFYPLVNKCGKCKCTAFKAIMEHRVEMVDLLPVPSLTEEGCIFYRIRAPRKELRKYNTYCNVL